MTSTQALRHLVRLTDLGQEEVDAILNASAQIRHEGTERSLAGQTLGLLFFRGSLRTRASFEAAVGQLGGHPIDLNSSSDFWDLEHREEASWTAQLLSTSATRRRCSLVT